MPRQIKMRVPKAGAPTGRPLREDEYTIVTWTVESPDDDPRSTKVALRRQRVLRLLEEARAQGTAPTQTHLAQALGVSRRTIEREMWPP